MYVAVGLAVCVFALLDVSEQSVQLAPHTYLTAGPSVSMQEIPCGRETPSTVVELNVRDSLTIAVQVDRETYDLGDPISFTISITNHTAGIVAFESHFNIYDLVLVTSFGPAAGLRPNPFPYDRIFCTLQPGQTMALSWGINAGLRSGSYTVRASLPQGPEASTHFSVRGSETDARIPLFGGCNNVTLTWPDATATGVVADAVNPPSSLIAIWRFDNARQTFVAFSPLPGAPTDLTTVNRLDAVFICVREAGALARPTSGG